MEQMRTPRQIAESAGSALGVGARDRQQGGPERIQAPAGRSGIEGDDQGVRYRAAISDRPEVSQDEEGGDAVKHWRLALLIVCVSVLSSQPSGREQVGRLPDGSFLLSTGWRIQPVGTQVPLDTFPMSSALSRDGKFLLVLNGGYRPPTISVLSVDGMKEIAKVPVADGWLGLTFSPDGTRVYVGGGSKYCVFEFSFSQRRPVEADARIGGHAGSQAGRNRFYRRRGGLAGWAVDLRGGFVSRFRGGLRCAIGPSRRGHYKTGRRPYRILFHPGRQVVLCFELGGRRGVSIRNANGLGDHAHPRWGRTPRTWC